MLKHMKKVLNTSKQYIIKDTNRKFNNIDILSIIDNKIQETTMITTQNNTSPNKRILKAKFLREIERMKSKSESTNTTNYIDKDILVRNTIKDESELTNSRNKTT